MENEEEKNRYIERHDARGGRARENTHAIERENLFIPMSLRPIFFLCLFSIRLNLLSHKNMIIYA